MNRERRTDDGTYPDVEEERAKIAERASASRVPLTVSARDALETLGELSDGYGPFLKDKRMGRYSYEEVQLCFDILEELLTAAEEFVKEESANKDLPPESIEFQRLKLSLEGRSL